MNGTHQFHADDSILGESVRTEKKNTGFIMFCKKTGLEISAERTKCVFVSHEQKEGRNHNM